MPKQLIRDIPGMQLCLIRPIIKLQPGLLSVLFTTPDIVCGDLPGAGIIIPLIGLPGDPITGTTIMDTILTGIITIIRITVIGITIGADHIIPSIVTVYVYTVLLWL